MVKPVFIFFIFSLCMTGRAFNQDIPEAKVIQNALSMHDTLTYDPNNGKLMLQRAVNMVDWNAVMSFGIICKVFRKAVNESDISLKADAYVAFGRNYDRKRHYLFTMQSYMAAINNYQMVYDTAQIIYTLQLIGGLNQTLNHTAEAGNYLYQSIRLAKLNKNNSLLGSGYYFMGSIFLSSGKYDLAGIYYDLALKCFKQDHITDNIFRTQNGKGAILINQKKYEEALLFYNELAKNYEDTNLNRGVIYTRIGHIYDQQGDFRKSLLYNRMALKIRLKAHVPTDIASSLINLAGDYLNLGLPDSAMLYMNPGLTFAYNNNYLHFLANGYKHLYRYYHKSGNNKEALEYYLQYGNLTEKIKIERNQAFNAIIRVQNKLQKQDDDGKWLMQQERIRQLIIANQQYPFFLALVLACIGGIILMIIFMVYIYNRRARQKMQTIHHKLTQEMNERAIKEQETRISERKFRFLTENSIDFITLVDREFNKVYVSPNSLDFVGYEAAELLQIPDSQIIHPEHLEKITTEMKEMIAEKTPKEFVYQALRKDGTPFWVEMIANPLYNSISGDFNGLITVTRNIQERKIKEKEIMDGTKQKETLLKEIHHRVKNNFAILVSLINMQIAQTKEKELQKSLTNLQLRIRSMALVHEMLYRSDDFEKISFPEYLRTLASVITGTFSRRNIQLTIEAAEAVINIDASIPLGLIVNELLSNAYIHGFPDGKAGNILLGFSKIPGNGKYQLIIRDDGVGFPDGFILEHATTMGLQIVKLLSRQLEGTLELENHSGSTFSITFEIDHN